MNTMSAAKAMSGTKILYSETPKNENSVFVESIDCNKTVVKPFLKWAGGKSQLLNEIRNYYPFENGNIKKYAEPFVGGGAVLFDIINKFDLEEVYISDINEELINTYTAIKLYVDELLNLLADYQNDYIPLEAQERRLYFETKRNRFNSLKNTDGDAQKIERAALMIFLNRTCFNGLYRVNKKGFFNVPVGSYKNPLICDAENLRAVSKKIGNVQIVYGDYSRAADFIDNNTFVYFDPPYRPISNTANFTAYTRDAFGDGEQLELSKFAKRMNEKGAMILMSNSDPKNFDCEDNFFDDIYSGFKIKRVGANRMINCNGTSRGKINELLISNFER